MPVQARTGEGGIEDPQGNGGGGGENSAVPFNASSRGAFSRMADNGVSCLHGRHPFPAGGQHRTATITFAEYSVAKVINLVEG